MICAEDELGIGTSHEGIMVLPSESKVGTTAKEFLNLQSDTIFEIGLTQTGWMLLLILVSQETYHLF